VFGRDRSSAKLVALLEEIRNEQTATHRTVGRQLERIHTLVNSNLTAAMRAELEATVRDAASMSEVIELRRAAGHDPSPEAVEAVDATASRIEELRSVIGNRVEATELAEEQARED
jgi:hypothetical protein